MTAQRLARAARHPARRLLAGPEVGETRIVGFLRWLGWRQRYRQWLAAIWGAVVVAARDKVKSAATGAPPPGAEPDATVMPSYYRQLLEWPDQPDRPPLTKFEKASPGEATAIRSVSRLAAGAVIGAYCEARKGDRGARAMRDQHAKHHGCLQATFIVHDNLPAEFAVGVFRPGRRYPAVVRFSNAMSSRQNDRTRDGRGMAVKLREVNAHSLLSTLLPQHRGGEQDFLMTNHPVFFCKNADEYTRFMTTMAMPRRTRGERLRFYWRFGCFFLRRPRQLLILLRTASQRVRSPLAIPYHSMTPYQLGEDRVVRYLATPIPSARSATEAEEPLGNDFLRDALVAALKPDQPADDAAVVFDFAVQVRHAATPDDVENASKRWRRGKDKTVSLGRIEIPVQRFDTAGHLNACEDLSFNPWNCLPQHRPLGSLNRMRLAVYTASMRVRHRLNSL
jgi:catalase